MFFKFCLFIVVGRKGYVNCGISNYIIIDVYDVNWVFRVNIVIFIRFIFISNKYFIIIMVKGNYIG